MMGRAGPDMAMGVHYFRSDMLGISGPPDPRVDGTGYHTDFLKPAILIYEPQATVRWCWSPSESCIQKGLARGRHAEPPSFMGVAL